MSGLNSRQRVQANAALALIYRSGGDANAVNAQAREFQDQGHSASHAFGMAFTAYGVANPHVASALSRTVNLIGKSDDATLARYDEALTAFNETGDDAAFDDLRMMVAQDAVALAVRDGEIPAGAGPEALEAAGYGATPEMIEAMGAACAAPVATPEAQPAQADSFAFHNQSEEQDLNTNNSRASSYAASPVTPGAVSSWKPRANETTSFYGAGEMSPGAVRSAKTGEARAREIGVPLAYAVAQGMIPAQDS